MRELPRGWVWSTLGEILKFQYGKSLPSDSRTAGSVQVIGSSGVLGAHDAALTKSACLVIGRKGAAGAVYLCPDPCWPVDTVYFAYPPSGLCVEFLYHLLSSLELRRLDKSTAVPSLLRQDLEAVNVPIPPEPEQRRIVAEVEKQFTRLDNGVNELTVAAERVRAYAQAVLNSLTRPKLQMPHAWGQITLGELAHIGTGSTPLRSTGDFWREGTVPWVTSTAVNQPFVDEPQDFVTKVALQKVGLKTYPAGTLLMAMYGEGKTRGKVAELRIDATINQALAAIQIRPEWGEWREYIKFALTSSYDQIRRKASGGVQPNLNLGMVNALAIWLPPRSEVEEITWAIGSQLTQAKNFRSTVSIALSRAARLRQSILKSAFEGKLVPQDPNDERASVLLERLRASRAHAPSARVRYAKNRVVDNSR